jgi:tRNA(Ile)-lysidine synthase
VRRAVAAWVASLPPADGPVAFALSGGRDSMTLLDAGAAALAAAGRRAVALHVHHGLQSGADAWADACARACEARGVPFAMRRVAIARAPRQSLEALAREARYRALASLARANGATTVALAHHQDDQAETLLLQLGRGAGPAGLAAMPASTFDAAGLCWCRPLIGVARAGIDAYAHARRLDWVDDPSNADERLRRNAVRARIAPAFAAALPGYPATLARAAAHQADAAALMDALAALDARSAGFDEASGTIASAALSGLEPARARNLLRWFLHSRGLPPPPAARLDAMLRQLAGARRDATIELPHAGALVGRHRGRVVVHGPSPGDYLRAWHGESAIALPHGELAFESVEGAGVDARRAGAGLEIRPRRGGERLRLAAGGARRALKSLLREANLPSWERDALPLVVAGDALVAVPGLGVDVDWRAPPGAVGLVPVWRRTPGAP